MSPTFSASDVLGAMITPAVLISASGTLVLSTSNRLTRVVDRVRSLAAEAEGIRRDGREGAPGIEERMRHISDQLPVLARRAVLLRSTLTALYTTIGFLVTTSIAVAVVAVIGWAYGWIAVVTGLAGACALLYGSLLLVREARLAIGFTLQEMSYLDETVRGTARGG